MVLVINLSLLTVEQVDWLLKNIVQACIGLSIMSDPVIYEYGCALYRVIATPSSEIWKGDFSVDQRSWIDVAAVSR